MRTMVEKKVGSIPFYSSPQFLFGKIAAGKQKEEKIKIKAAIEL